MNDPPKNEDRELIDLLITISVISPHLARKLENQRPKKQQPKNIPIIKFRSSST